MAIGAAPGKDGDDVDGFGDQRTRDGDDGFLNELLEPAQRSNRGARMNGADTARMTRAPGLEQIERLCTTDLPNRNAIGSSLSRTRGSFSARHRIS